jgi:hypothetical protein
MTFITSPDIWIREVDRAYYWEDHITYGEIRRIETIDILSDNLYNYKNNPEKYAAEIIETEAKIKQIQKELDDYTINLKQNS